MLRLLSLFVIEVIDIYQPVFFQTHKLKVSLLLFLFLTAIVHSVCAIEQFTINIETLKTPNIRLNNVSFSVDHFRLKKNKLSVSIDEFVVNDFRSQHLSIDCDETFVSSDLIHCAKGSLNFAHSMVKAKRAPLTFRMNPVTGQSQVNLSHLKAFGGKLSTHTTFTEHHLISKMKLHQLQFNNKELKEWLPVDDKIISFNNTVSGEISIKVQNNRMDSHFSFVNEKGAFSDSLGEYIGDDLNYSLTGEIKKTSQNQLTGYLKGKVSKGEVLTPFFYTDLKALPTQFLLNQFHYDLETDQWRIKNFSYTDPNIHLTANDISGENSILSQATIELANTSLEKLYPQYFQPVFSHELAQMNVEGFIKASLSVNQQKIESYSIDLSSVNAEHQPNEGGASKYLILGLNARIKSHSTDSFIEFNEVNFLDVLNFGHTLFPLTVTKNKIGLNQTTRLPIFDGDLLIDQFSIQRLNQHSEVEFQGVLSPISLSSLTQALDWPLMNGKISGVIPSVTYRDGNVKLAGTLLIKAFDGNILLNHVQASHLLSSWPVFNADIKLQKINLESLTQTFEFGRITGLMDGRIDGLVLENWQPTAFDAKFLTSKESKSKRISQKAVDNISNLGGVGVAGALSRTFMRFFDDFGYDKIGISCHLKNNICEMDGVEAINQGYYLVKGGGIPRIDIIGYNRKTNWDILLDRLIHLSDAGSPNIQ